MEESVGAEDIEFKWGKKRGVGGKKKDVRFYESFTYDGDEYCLYDCVLVGDSSDPDSCEPFVGMIIKIWEDSKKRGTSPRQVKLLWFFKPFEILPYLEGVPDVLPNELFLASGEGPGLANVNQLEAIGGKCSVLCISKDKRNPQPSLEEINSADFVFRRAFDVGSHKVLDTIDDKIAGVDVQFIFNRASCKKEAVQEIKADINGNSNSLQPNGPSTSGSVRRIEDNSTESSDHKESSDDCKEGREKGHNQLATKKSTLAEERSNKDSGVQGVQEGMTHNEHDPCEASGSRGDHCNGKAQGSEVKTRLTKQKSMPAEERDSISCEASGSRVNHSNVQKANDGNKQLAKQKSMSAKERDSTSCEASGSRVNHSDVKNAEANDGKKQLPKQKSMLAEERDSPSCEASGSKVNHSDVRKAQENDGKKQLVKQKSMPAEERDSTSGEASGSKVNHSDVRKVQANDGKKQFAKQKSMPVEERDSISGEASGSRVNHSDVKKAQANGVNKQWTKQKSMPAEARYSEDFKKAQANDVNKQWTKQKSMPAEARYSEDLNGLDDRPQKKQKLDGSATVPDGRNINMLQNRSSDGKKDTEYFKRPKDKVTGDEVPPERPSFGKKKRDLELSVSEGKYAKTATEKGLSKRPSFDGKQLKRAEDRMVAVDYERNYQVTEVSRKPDAVNSKWFRPLPWEESMREAEEQERLVLLGNLDPTYTSEEVQDLVYSALNEQCTARMIERTSATVPHIGQALVIFNSREAAERVVGRIEEGCLLLSNGRPLVAAFAKINPPGKLSSFRGHIKLHKTQTRRDTREALAVSHCTQENTVEFEMSMEWWLHQARSQHAIERVFKRQLEEKNLRRINFKPKLS